MTPPVDSGPKLLLDWQMPEAPKRFLRAGVGSIAAHLVILFLVVLLTSLDTRPFEPEPELARIHTRVTPLIAPLPPPPPPPTPLTQKEPNRTKVAKEVKLENLLPQPEIAERIPTPPAPPPKLFKAPPQTAAPPVPKPAIMQPPPEAPRIQASLKTPHVLPQLPVALPNAPVIEPVEKPKLAFEVPVQRGPAPAPAAQTQKGVGVTAAKIPVPKATVDEAVRSIAHGGGQGGIMVGDADQGPSLGDVLRQPPSRGKTASSLELLSDPMGIDFKPYLIRILATVRRNWFAVIPESARLGRRGKVTLQFAIDRSGGVPKLVIAMPSGAEALDRAAVAGISASVPFPPLPKEFPGQQIRLQFAFQYNQ